MPKEIVVNWVTLNGGGKVSVFWADETPLIADQREALGDMIRDFQAQLHSSTSWSIATEGRIVNATTGTLTGQWAETTNQAGVGAAASAPGADATQALLRWQTATIINGRFLQGRTFIPGLSRDAIVLGNLSASAIADFQGAADGLVTADVGFGVWHRPTSGTGGAFHDYTSAGVWNELAVLRRRRG